MMKYIVIGGAGFIGSHVAEELISNSNNEVIIFDNLSVGKIENVPPKCILFKGDIRSKPDLLKVMQDVDVVIHDAAFVSIRGSFNKLRDEIEANCLGTLNVLEAAAESGAKKVVFASSMAVYGEPSKLPVTETDSCFPNSPYGLSKLRGEMYLKIFKEEYGLNYTALRYFNTYGIRQTPSPYVGVMTTFINQALSEKVLTVYGDGNQTRDFVWVKDVAHATVLAGSSNATGTFNIASGVNMSVNAIANIIVQHTGGSKTHLDAPPGEIHDIYADISRAKDLLNYYPTGEVVKIIPSIIDYWRKILKK